MCQFLYICFFKKKLINIFSSYFKKKTTDVSFCSPTNNVRFESRHNREKFKSGQKQLRFPRAIFPFQPAKQPRGQIDVDMLR